MKLPAPSKDGRISLEKTIEKWRSVRAFAAKKLSLEQMGQLAWAAQGITSPRGYRASPSAGALYPLEIYFVTEEAVYRYIPAEHGFELHKEGDARRALSEAALGQGFVADAPLDIVIAAVYERTARKYGERSRRYVHIEVGHAGQNILLQAVALGLGAVPVGAFHDKAVAKALSLPADHEPLYIISVGYPE